jgi:RTX calcium-binding nonapeptide repeat (4 copies)
MAAGNAAATLVGDADADIIFGGFGNDSIYGGTNAAGLDYIAGYYGIDSMYGGTGTDGFNLVYDVRAGEYDYINDWNVGGNQDQIYLNAAYSVATSWTQQSGYVDITVFLGNTSYHTYVIGSGVTVANVQSNTYFV